MKPTFEAQARKMVVLYARRSEPENAQALKDMVAETTKYELATFIAYVDYFVLQANGFDLEKEERLNQRDTSVMVDYILYRFE